MDRATYQDRRSELRRNAGEGAILLLGQQEAPRNYLANPYPFRQDSHFLYYVGADLADLAMLMTPDGEERLFGPPEDPDDLIWHGPHRVLADHAAAAGIARTGDPEALARQVKTLQEKGVTIHYLPPYRVDQALRLSKLLDRPLDRISEGHSRDLVRWVVDQRSVKSDAEVAEIEEALSISADMYAAAMERIEPGRTEAEIAGAMQGVALARGRAQSFLPIVSIHGEVLHNTSYANTMSGEDLLLIDSGTESARYYASDITRTLPVSGRFTEQQQSIYEVVLAGQQAAIAAASPTRSMKELHLTAARTMAAGLRDVGLMRGDVEEAVAEGAHALFFVHGLGHMLGLDVHDMEDLGDAVGYAEGESRSEQFGLSLLRLARQLQPGFTITIEPGIYFVPALIDRWKAEGRHTGFIDYDAVEAYRGFGGVRIEDDVLITAEGARVLGPPIPKTVTEVEAALAASRE